MCNNCINKTDNMPDPEDVLNDLASDITTKGYVKFKDAIEAMKHYASSATAHVRSENKELKLQVSALTQALETQKRENQPYIKELERREQTYREALEKILLLFQYGQFSEGLPESLTIPVSRIINDRNICLVVNPKMCGLSIYINSLDATGGDKPEQEQ